MPDPRFLIVFPFFSPLFTNSPAFETVFDADPLRMRRRKKFSRTWPRFWDVKIAYLSVKISTTSERGDFFWQIRGLETKDSPAQSPAAAAARGCPRLPAAARGMESKSPVRSPGTRAGPRDDARMHKANSLKLRRG